LKKLNQLWIYIFFLIDVELAGGVITAMFAIPTLDAYMEHAKNHGNAAVSPVGLASSVIRVGILFLKWNILWSYYIIGILFSHIEIATCDSFKSDTREPYCLNEGTCFDSLMKEGRNMTMLCNCSEGFSGSRCQYNNELNKTRLPVDGFGGITRLPWNTSVIRQGIEYKRELIINSIVSPAKKWLI